VSRRELWLGFIERIATLLVEMTWGSLSFNRKLRRLARYAVLPYRSTNTNTNKWSAAPRDLAIC